MREGYGFSYDEYQFVIDKTKHTIQESFMDEYNSTPIYKMRPAKESDLDFVYFSELETVNENKNDPKVQRYIKKDAKESLGHTKIIVVDKTDVGVYQAYATNEWGLREGKRDWWYLAHIYIKPEYQGRGIGTEIIKNDISEHDKILLQVMKSNKRAKKLYESLGFVVSQENDHGGLVMRLDKSKTVQEGFVDTLFTQRTGFQVPSKLPSYDAQYIQSHANELRAVRKSASNYYITPESIHDTYLFEQFDDLMKNIAYSTDFDRYNELRRFLFSVLGLPENCTVNLEGYWPERGTGCNFKIRGLGNQGKSLAPNDVLYHSSMTTGLTELVPAFMSRKSTTLRGLPGVRTLKIEALFPEPRVYVGLNKCVSRIGGDVIQGSKERVYKILHNPKVVYEDGELSGGAAYYIQSQQPIPVEDVTDEYFAKLKAKQNPQQQQQSQQPKPDVTTTQSQQQPKPTVSTTQAKPAVTAKPTTTPSVTPVKPEQKPTQESFVQEDIDIGALASAGLAAWEGSKQLKAESMDISMFKRLPMTRENLEKYSSGHGTFIQDLENYRLTPSDDGVILVDEHDIVAGLVIVRRTDNGEVWITRLARSLEWKNDGIVLQLAKLAVDEFDAEFAAIDQNNTYVSKLLLNHGWKLLEQESGMCLMRYVGGEEDEASEYTATDEDKNKFDEIMSEYMLEWGSSGKLFYHLSDQRSLDGQVFKPRVPAYIEPYNPHETAFENSTTPRVCFSSTIEGALNAITVNVQRTNPVTFRDMYVYIPEKPINEYKHKTNKELIRDHDVYDANVTKEMWILEPVRLKLYGVIHVDQARSVKRKPTVKTVDGQRDTRNYFTYKWHWLVKPKVLDSNPFHYDTMAVCRRLADEVNHFKYGLVKNGKFDTNPKDDDWDEYWKLQSPEQFEQSGGGNCFDFVEWEAGYLDAYGIPYKKYLITSTNGHGAYPTHSFIVAPNNGKYIYIEAAFKRVADEIHNIKEFDSLQSIFKYVAECLCEYQGWKEMFFGIFDFTDNTPKIGSSCNQYIKWICDKCKNVYDGAIKNKTKKRSESK